MKKTKNLIITIDGPSSSGKSTLAKDLARKLDYTYIDSGAMYRALTWLCIQKKVFEHNEVNIEKLTRLLKSIKIRFKYNHKTKDNELYLNKKKLDRELRTIEVSEKVSIISAIDIVRKKMVALQREMGKHKRIVMDGRDIGSVVFPEADMKIYLTANIDVRAQRRFKELFITDKNISYQKVKSNLLLRDKIDSSRKIAPLVVPENAIILDNSQLTREQQLSYALRIIESKL